MNLNEATSYWAKQKSRNQREGGGNKKFATTKTTINPGTIKKSSHNKVKSRTKRAAVPYGSVMSTLILIINCTKLFLFFSKLYVYHVEQTDTT